MQKIIFISGTGRSGTNLVGRAISSHPEIEGRIEDPKTFSVFTKLGTTQDIRSAFSNWALRALLFRRLDAVFKSTSLNVLEKSHPSIWLYDKLAKRYANAYFLGVWRNVEPTVSSMLAHDGVLSWYDRLPQDRPNRFLGITERNKDYFDTYSLEEKCALRWLSHKNELDRLRSYYSDRVRLIKYEHFMNDPAAFFSELSSLLEIPNSFAPEEFDMTSLDKWKKKLSEEQVAKIRAVIDKEGTQNATASV